MTPFQIAERFMQLREKYAPTSWVSTVELMNDMILMPFIALFLLFTQKASTMMLLSTTLTAYNRWKGWFEYHALRHEVQHMYLKCMTMGGPFIVTNHVKYMPYVFADAVVRHETRHPRPVQDLQQEP